MYCRSSYLVIHISSTFSVFIVHILVPLLGLEENISASVETDIIRPITKEYLMVLWWKVSEKLE